MYLKNYRWSLIYKFLIKWFLDTYFSYFDDYKFKYLYKSFEELTTIAEIEVIIKISRKSGDEVVEVIVKLRYILFQYFKSINWSRISTSPS